MAILTPDGPLDTESFKIDPDDPDSWVRYPTVTGWLMDNRTLLIRRGEKKSSMIDLSRLSEAEMEKLIYAYYGEIWD